MDAIKSRGIRLESQAFGTFTARPDAFEELRESPGVLIVTVKAPFLESALDRIPAALAVNALVVPLLNGIEHMAVLRTRFPANVVAGAIAGFEAVAAEPGRIVHTSLVPTVHLASDNPALRSRAEQFAELLERVAKRERGIEVIRSG
jgi:2-dehydropantoate 2-reductase